MSQVGNRPLFVKVHDGPTERNFKETLRLFVEAWSGAWAHETTYDLLPGDNLVKPPIPRPKGRVFTYQSSPAIVYDKTSQVDSHGMWILHASESVTIHIAWY